MTAIDTHPRGRILRRLLLGLAALLLLALAQVPIRASAVGYVLKQGWFQLEVLTGAIPNERALEDPDLTEDERARLSEVEAIKAFGQEVVGLSPTRNYEKTNLAFSRTIYSITASPPDRLEPHIWRFPIVGGVPYLGFFRASDRDWLLSVMEEAGWVARSREVGAYSTLGWFRDPVLKRQLGWSRYRFANTVLHELAHATLFIGSEGSFNESWATFIGNEASLAYMRTQLDEEGMEELLAGIRDGQRYSNFLRATYRDLNALYHAGLVGEELDAARAAFWEGHLSRLRAVPFETQRYREWEPEDVPDNATMVLYRTYSTRMELFDDALERFDGDLSAFIVASQVLAEADDPWQALIEMGPG